MGDTKSHFVVIVSLMLMGCAGQMVPGSIVSQDGRTLSFSVCAFCATGIEKTFKKQAAIDDVKVDLASKLITLHTKPDQTLDDATIRKLVGDAGYDITKIERK